MFRKNRIASLLLTTTLVSVQGACSLAPHYTPPAAPTVPLAYQHTDDVWQTARPSDRIQRGAWWTLYQDTVLNDLESQVDAANPDIAIAVGNYDIANAYTREAQSSFFPTINSSVNPTRDRQSDDRPLRGSGQPDVYDANTAQLGIGYEIDLWGRVRNAVAAGKDSAQAVQADLESLRLSLHAQLADTYVELRGLDDEAQLLSDTIDAYARSLQLTENRHAGGIASGLDVSRAQTQLHAAKAQYADVLSQRALYQDAIATLVGVAAPGFHIDPKVENLSVPEVPAGLPSTLLERRPDVAAAERRAAAANAEIGVAKAAFFPTLSLSAAGGFQSAQVGGWISAPDSFWTLGPALALMVFDGGRRRAELAEARTRFDQAGARYRAVVLQAFQQVQDNLALLTLLKQESMEEQQAVDAANRSTDMAMNRYREGSVSYLEVVDAQTAALTIQRARLALQTHRVQASVGLIKALGGGWDRTVQG